MRLSDIFEQQDQQDPNIQQLNNLIDTKLVLAMFNGDQFYIIQDIPNTVTDQQLNHLYKMSFTPVQQDWLRIVGNWEPVREKGMFNIADLKEIAKEPDPFSVFSLWNWKQFVEEQKMIFDQMEPDDFDQHDYNNIV